MLSSSNVENEFKDILKDTAEDIAFISLGQMGGNLGRLFESLCGFNTLYINSSKEDLDSLINVKHKYHIPNEEGAGNDRKVAEDILRNNKNTVFGRIETHIKQKIIFVCFSSDGGFGSGTAPIIIKYLTESPDFKNKIICGITNLPNDSESIQSKINSYNCFKELEQITKMGTLFVIDNNKGDNDKLNDIFLHLFSHFMLLPKHINPLSNIDKAERDKLLETNGMCVITKNNLEDGSSVVFEDLKSSNVFVDIELDQKITYVAYSTSSDFEIDSKSISSEFGLFADDFKAYNQKFTIMAMVGLSLPYTRLKSFKKYVDENIDVVNKNLLREKILDEDIGSQLKININKEKDEDFIDEWLKK